MYCIVLYCIVLYCIVLYCIVLYCIVLYCIVLYCIGKANTCFYDISPLLRFSKSTPSKKLAGHLSMMTVGSSVELSESTAEPAWLWSSDASAEKVIHVLTLRKYAHAIYGDISRL